MTEHDKLVKILDRIKHKPQSIIDFRPGYYEESSIIFRQDFMDKYLNSLAHRFIDAQQCRNYINIDFAKIKSELLLNLDSALDFIYGTLFEDKLEESNLKYKK